MKMLGTACDKALIKETRNIFITLSKNIALKKITV